MATTIRPARRWVTPEGGRIDLIYRTGTGRARVNPRARDAWMTGGLIAGGWWMTVAHPNGYVISETHLGGEVDVEAQLRPGLEAVAAYEITGLPRPSAPRGE